MPPRILFSSPCGPYLKLPVEEDPVDYFYYRNTLGQKMLQLRSFQSWHSLHYLAQNLPVDSVVLENPTLERFQREVSSGQFQVVAIGFTVISTGVVLEMVSFCRRHFPEVEIVLGGYGTAVFKDPDEQTVRLRGQVDHVCVQEGLEFFRGYLERRWGVRRSLPQRQDFLPARNFLFRSRIELFQQLIFLGGLGCRGACPFCATSAQFDHARIRVASGSTLCEQLARGVRRHPRIRSAIVYEEDFLANRAEVLELIRCLEASEELRDHPLLLTVFASARSLAQYSMSELVRCRIGTVFVGVEAFSEAVLSREALAKRTGDMARLFSELHRHGINTLGSFIVGWDGHDETNLDDEIRRFAALNPTFYQVVPLHPVPGTPLWQKVRRQRRLMAGYAFERDSITHFIFELAQLTHERARRAVRDAYSLLVEEGGPWPFRMLENLLAGHQHLAFQADPALRARGRLYAGMIRQLAPLAFACRAFFHGPGFRRRWRAAMGLLLRRFGGTFAVAAAASVPLVPLLATTYALVNLRQWLSRRGDQPECLRTPYDNAAAPAP